MNRLIVELHKKDTHLDNLHNAVVAYALECFEHERPDIPLLLRPVHAKRRQEQDNTVGAILQCFDIVLDALRFIYFLQPDFNLTM